MHFLFDIPIRIVLFVLLVRFGATGCYAIVIHNYGHRSHCTVSEFITFSDQFWSITHCSVIVYRIDDYSSKIFPIVFRELFIHSHPFYFVPLAGSSTACVLILNRENSTVYTANIGDSGFIVVREGQIIHRSEEQQHYFNTPFQLSLPPPGQNVLSDSPESADTLSFPVRNGDVILAATDGVFDNVPSDLLLDILKDVSFQLVAILFINTITYNAIFLIFRLQCEGESNAVKLQMTANAIALMARSLSFDSEFMSPFSVNARRNNIHTTGECTS